jgi:hypothetical protein
MRADGWLCDRHHAWMTFASGCIECDTDLEHFLPARGDES